MRLTLLWITVAIMIGAGALMRFYHKHEDLPKGCDEFGYLNQAKAMSEHRTFENHSDRPWLPGLLDTLRSTGITEQEISWMIAPHAYHLIPETNTIINQYPPGTAFLLHFIPIEWRKISFPLLAMIILIISYGLARKDKEKITAQDILFTLFLPLIFFSPPFITELARVNSLAFTWGLLLAAGMVMEKRPLVAATLIGLTVNFRAANLLMLMPLILLMIPKGRLIPDLKKIMLFGIISLLAVSPLLIYNWQLTGSAFSTTYSAIDTAFAGWGQFTGNLLYYFDWDQRWFRVHLAVVIICVVFMILRKAAWNEYAGIILFPLLNYVFFLMHAVQMDYYPYASSVILAGWILGQLGKIPVGYAGRFFVPYMALIVGIIILTVGFDRFNQKQTSTFGEVVDSYKLLCNYDIVWADLYSGTSEYACGNNGFRYFTTTPRARKTAMQYLHNNGYSQLILLDDSPVEPPVVSSEVMKSGLAFRYSQSKFFLRLIIIE